MITFHSKVLSIAIGAGLACALYIWLEPTGDSLVGSMPTSQRSSDDRLLDAMILKESSGNDRAVGDAGASKGCLQIGRLYWQDAIDHSGADWEYDRLVWSRPHSRQIVKWYWNKYGAETVEKKCRIHNGGPAGMFKSGTISYWKKVEIIMKGL